MPPEKSKDGQFVESGTWLDRQIVEETKDLQSVDLWRAVLAEFLGTMMLCVWTIGMGLFVPGGEPASLLLLAFGTGAFITGLVTALLDVSGCHVNPAVSLGMIICKKITFIRFVFYSLAQCASSVVAVWVLQGTFPSDMHGSLGHIFPGPESSPGNVLSMEFLLGFFLMFGVASFIDSDRSDLEGLLPIYVGCLVTANILFGAGVSGGCMNPARYFGPAVITGNTDLLWAYSLGPMAGAAVGALIYNLLLSENTMLRSAACCKTKRKSSTGSRVPETEAMIQET